VPRWSARSCAKARGRRGLGAAIPEEKWRKKGLGALLTVERDRGGGGGRRPGGGAAPHGELLRKREDGGEGRPAQCGEKSKGAGRLTERRQTAFGQPLSGPARDLFPVRVCPDSAAPLGPSRRGTRRPDTAKRTPHVSDLHIQKPLKSNPPSGKIARK
jgi:hypothetical protein